MTTNTQKHLAAIALSLGLAVLYAITLLTAIHVVGTDAKLYYSEQMKADILPAAGIADGALRELDDRLASYLKGDAAALKEATARHREAAKLFRALGQTAWRIVQEGMTEQPGRPRAPNAAPGSPSAPRGGKGAACPAVRFSGPSGPENLPHDSKSGGRRHGDRPIWNLCLSQGRVAGRRGFW